MTRRSAALGALVVVAAVVFGTAGPTWADDAPVITIFEPGADAVVNSPEVTVRGEARMIEVNRIKAVTVTVTSAGGEPTRSDCWALDPAVLTGARATFSCTFSLTHNGPAAVTVRATGEELVEVNGLETREVRGPFKVEVPPAPPQDVRVEVGGDRRVTISWARNTEPDLSGYQVRRLAPDGSTDTLVGFTPQPPSGERVSATDPAVPAAGGAYQYVVVAVRPDGDGKVTARAIARSSPATAEIGAFAVGGARPGVGGVGPAAGARAPSAGRPRSGFDPSTFLSGGSELPPPPALPEGEALAGDDGFSLPGAEGAETSDPAVLGSGTSASNQRALVVPLAAGLLLTVLAFHLRQFSRAVLDAPPAYHPLPDWEASDGATRGPGRPR